MHHYTARICRTCTSLKSKERSRRLGRKPRLAPRFSTEPTECAYAAGILDGEGSIGIALHRKPTGPKRYHQLVIRITSTDPRLPTWLQLRFGGRITEHRRETQALSSPAQNWRVSARHAEAFLRAVLPYLVIKRDQAELALQFRATTSKVGKAQPVTPEVFAHRESLRLGIQQLNRRRRLMPEQHLTDTNLLEMEAPSG